MRSWLARIAVLALVTLGAGCSVVPLPKTMPMRGQTPRDQVWDVSDCQAEVAYQTHYSPTDSPLGNWFQKMFFWGVSGAALGAAITAFPTPAVLATFPSSTAVPTVTVQASEGVIAGAGAGAITGTALSWSGQPRFERGWVACMEAKGYALAPPAGGSAPGPGPSLGSSPGDAGPPQR